MHEKYVEEERLVDRYDLKKQQDRGSKRAYWQRKFTAWIRCVSQSTQPWIKTPLIIVFAWYFGIDRSKRMPASGKHFKHFDDFFTGQTATATKVPKTFPAQTLGSPVEGVLLHRGWVEDTLQFNVKGHKTSLLSLFMGDLSLSTPFSQGFFSHFYLAPRHYHRIHMPCDGHLVAAYHVPGSLYSVKPRVLGAIPGIMSNNERVILMFDTAYGLMSLVLVGAFLVGSIETAWSWTDTAEGSEQLWVSADMPNLRAWQPNKSLSFKRGDEVGRFHFGSSVLLFLEGKTAKPLIADATPVALYEPLAHVTPEDEA